MAVGAGVPSEVVYNDVTRSLMMTSNMLGKLGSIGQIETGVLAGAGE